MQWRRLGHIFVANGQHTWMRTHATCPTIEHLKGNIFRIYFASRDGRNRSHAGFVDIDINHPQKILQLSPEPVMAPGPRGAFDDSGTIPTCFLRIPSADCLYYMGWVTGTNVIARNSIGLAVRAKGQETFAKYSAAPIVDRNDIDPLTITYSWVMPRSAGGYHMWYCSNLTWGARDEEMQHVVKYAASDDGIHWRREGHISISLLPGEIAVSRPTVVEDSGGLHMWYCRRGEKYALGYAVSEDGKNWRRCDGEAGLIAEPDGWEQGSAHYPCVFDHGDQRFMLYNGGRYGSGGFGLAVQEK